MDATDTKQVGQTELASLLLIAAFCRRPNDRLFKNGLFFLSQDIHFISMAFINVDC
ncbi:hypothetical protein SAMD00079811_31680 [Scytonema sp. HK-05]|nr:hypothetical protein SAMD00079811_31680 [Scytonema sp. HK-05]